MNQVVPFLKAVGTVVVGVLVANYVQTNFLTKKTSATK